MFIGNFSKLIKHPITVIRKNTGNVYYRTIKAENITFTTETKKQMSDVLNWFKKNERKKGRGKKEKKNLYGS